MLVIIFQVWLSLWLAQSPAKPAKVVWNDWREEELKGKVQQVITESVKANEDATVTNEKVREKNSEIYYDPQGLRARQVNYFEGKPISTSTYQGSFAERTVTTTSAPGSPVVKRSYIHKYLLDEQGRPQRMQMLQQGTEYSRVEYEYDAQGFRKKGTTYINDKFNTTNNYTRDAKGVITELSATGFDNLTSRYLYSYEFDTQGNWIKRVTKSQLIINNQKTLAVSGIVFRTIKYY